MDAPVQYPVPWDLVFGLTPHIIHRTQRSVDDFSASVVARMKPEPEIRGMELLPENPRFLLVANHYQRQGLWILHSASVATQAIRKRYGAGDPPVRWVVTANWPAVRLGPWKFANPGDRLLPRVADALGCYAVSFAKNNPGFTARSIRRLLREAPGLTRPIGLFPEGVAGSAGTLTEPLPGVDRLISHLAKSGMPAVPMAISESGRLIVRCGATVAASELAAAPDSAHLLMKRIADLLA
ncbi:MAG: hypothetical protein ABI693_22050 [Bryobacteraceae bacterium]